MDIALQDVAAHGSRTADRLDTLMQEKFAPEHKQIISPIAGVPIGALRAVFVYDQEIEKRNRHAILWNMTKTHTFTKFVEWISRALVYTRPPIKSVIPNHTFLYYLKKMIHSQNKGLVAYLFAPVDSTSDAPAILAFKGSDFHPTGTAPIACMLADIEQNIGLADFASIESDLMSIDVPANGQKKMVVCGHSLGGVAAQRFCKKVPEIVGELYLFNSPGIEHEEATNVKEEPLLKSKNKPTFSVEIFVTEEDIVDRVNGLPLTTKNTKVNVCSIGFWRRMFAHTYLTLNNPLEYDLRASMRQITNQKAAELFLEARYSETLEFGRRLLRGVFSWPLKLVARIPEPEWLKRRDAALAMELSLDDDEEEKDVVKIEMENDE